MDPSDVTSLRGRRVIRVPRGRLAKCLSALLRALVRLVVEIGAERGESRSRLAGDDGDTSTFGSGIARFIGLPDHLIVDGIHRELAGPESFVYLLFGDSLLESVSHGRMLAKPAGLRDVGHDLEPHDTLEIGFLALRRSILEPGVFG